MDEIVIISSSPSICKKRYDIAVSSPPAMIEVLSDEDDTEIKITQSVRQNPQHEKENWIVSPLKSSPLKDVTTSRKRSQPLADSSYVSDLSDIDIFNSAAKRFKSILGDEDDRATPVRQIVSETKKASPRAPIITANPPDYTGDTESELESLLKFHKKTNPKALNNANKTNRQKDDLLAEMTLRISSTLAEDIDAESLAPISVSNHDDDACLIHWFRDVNTKYYGAQDVFIPLQDPEITQENLSVLYFAVNNSFIEDLKSGQLDTRIQSIRSVHGDARCLVLMLCNQDSYFASLKSKQNRAYTQQIRQQLEGITATTVQNEPPVNGLMRKQEFEALLIDLQIRHRLHLFPTKNDHDSMTWLRAFTYTVASMRYDKFERQSELASIGVVRSGKDRQDTLLKSLQHFKFVTPLVASKIMQNSKNFVQLSESYRVNKRLEIHGVRETVDTALYEFFNTDDPDAILF